MVAGLEDASAGGVEGFFQGTDVLPIEVCSRINSVDVHEPSEKSYLPGEPVVPVELRTWKLHIVGMDGAVGASAREEGQGWEFESSDVWEVSEVNCDQRGGDGGESSRAAWRERRGWSRFSSATHRVAWTLVRGLRL